MAQARGFPMNVGPCIITPDWDEEIMSATFAEAATVAKVIYQHNVRLYAGVFTGKQFARAAETCRYLVENKKYSAVIAFFA